MAAVGELTGVLGFTPPDDVEPDDERPGLLRALHRPPGDPDRVLDLHSCRLVDGAQPDAVEPGLEQAGFETIDLSGNAPLQAVLARVRDDGRIDDETAAALRSSLDGAEFALRNGRTLRIDHVAEDGLIHRQAGPAELPIDIGEMDGRNGHSGASNVHGDQDVYGTPLRQMMKGAAPEMFRHQTPDGRNDHASTFLLNCWIPLQQITRPLVLMDRRTLDARRHQLRYGLPVTGFLDRDDDKSVNDIWAFLHDDGQVWHVRSQMGPDQAYVFDTLGEPHGAAILPGEDALAELHTRLAATGKAVEAGDAVAVKHAAAGSPPSLPEVTTEAIRAAWERMVALQGDAAARADELATDGEAWLADVAEAMDAVVRKSIELRLVTTMLSD